MKKIRINIVLVYFIITIVNSIVLCLFADINNLMSYFIVIENCYFVESLTLSFENVFNCDELEILFFDNNLMFND